MKSILSLSVLIHSFCLFICVVGLYKGPDICDLYVSLTVYSIKYKSSKMYTIFKIAHFFIFKFSFKYN